MRFSRMVMALVFAPALSACTSGADARSRASASRSPDTTDVRVRRADLARIMGDSGAKVWFVIVSDFQCPYCKLWHDSSGPEITRDYVQRGKIRLAYVNFPLGQHLNAVPAAEAAMCAGAQEKFWSFHDQLFGTQDEWAQLRNAEPVFDRIASALGLDQTAFSACLRDDVMLPMIAADRERGRVGGVSGTPAFFIGNRRVDNAQPAAYLRPILDSAIAAARSGGRAR